TRLATSSRSSFSGTEARLRSGIPRRPLQSLDSITPYGVLEMLENRKLADPSVLDDPKEALRLGYRFDSFRDRYQAMFDVLKQRQPVLDLVLGNVQAL
ncbi:hypothetical protein ACV36O_30380, partial [Pseudomonas aeruginosa]